MGGQLGNSLDNVKQSMKDGDTDWLSGKEKALRAGLGGAMGAFNGLQPSHPPSGVQPMMPIPQPQVSFPQPQQYTGTPGNMMNWTQDPLKNSAFYGLKPGANNNLPPGMIDFFGRY